MDRLAVRLRTDLEQRRCSVVWFLQTAEGSPVTC